MRRFALTVLAAMACALPAWAIDYRSVDAPVAVMYDAPSLKAKKLYLIKRQTPVELVIRLDNWSKVRDAEGSLAWVESRVLSDKRSVVVIAPRAEVRQAARPDAPLAFEAEKWVLMELLEPAVSGWASVRHRDGATGYVKASQVWGL